MADTIRSIYPCNGDAYLIVYLVKLNRRQKEIARHKTETEVLYRELIRQDRLSTMVELTASLSHEVNQPLTAILYTAQAGKRFLSGKPGCTAGGRDL